MYIVLWDVFNKYKTLLEMKTERKGKDKKTLSYQNGRHKNLFKYVCRDIYSINSKHNMARNEDRKEVCG